MKMQSNSSIYSLQSSRLDQQAVFTTSAQKHHGRHDFPSSWLCIDWNQKPKKESWPLWEWKNHKKNALPQPPALKKSSRVDMEYFPDLFSPLHSLQKPFVAMQVFAWFMLPKASAITSREWLKSFGFPFLPSTNSICGFETELRGRVSLKSLYTDTTSGVKPCQWCA